jgi:hypothetical protein
MDEEAMRQKILEKQILMFQRASNCFEETFMLINLLFFEKMQTINFLF